MGIMVYSLLWVMQDFVHQPFGSFRILGVPYFGALIRRILIIELLYKAKK